MSMSCAYREELENLVLVMLEQGTPAAEIESEVRDICEAFVWQKAEKVER